MAHRRSGEIPPPFSPLRRRNGQRRLADTGVFGSGKRLGPVVAYITIRMADRSKTSAPTYPPVTSFTHTHTRARARFLGRVHAIAHSFASINVHARPRSSTLSTLSTIESLSRVLVLRSNLLPLPRARWNQRWKECSADRNGRNAERLVLDAGN